MDANKLVLKEVKILSQHFSEELMKQAANLIKEFNSTPDEVILHEGETSSQNSIYFIEKGRCEVYQEKNGKVQSIKILNKGDQFGSYGFFTGNQRLCSVRSKEFCTLLQINRQDFLDLCKQHLQDYEKFSFIKDKLQFEKDLSLIDEHCYQCKEMTHNFSEYPKKHFNNKSDYITYILKDQALTQIKRAYFDRSKRKSLTPRKHIKEFVTSINKYQQRNVRELSKYMIDNYVNVLHSMYDSDESLNEKSQFYVSQSEDFQFQIPSSIKKTKPEVKQSKLRTNKKHPTKYSEESVFLNGSDDYFNANDETKQVEMETSPKNKINHPQRTQKSPKTLFIPNTTETNSENHSDLLLEQVNVKSNEQIQGEQKFLIEQIKNSQFFQNIFRSQLEKGFEKLMKKQKLIPPPPSNQQSQFNKEPFILKKQNENIEVKRRVKNQKQRLSGVDKMTKQVKNIMTVSALFNKRQKQKKQMKEGEQDLNEESATQQPNQSKSNNQLTFYLLQQNNIKEQSYSYELLQKQFEHLNKYKMYYPSDNYDVIINSYNMQNFEKHKPQNDSKKKFLNIIERSLFFQQPLLNQDGSQANQNAQEMLSLFNQYRGRQSQKSKQSIVKDYQSSSILLQQQSMLNSTLPLSSKRQRLLETQVDQDQIMPISKIHDTITPQNNHNITNQDHIIKQLINQKTNDQEEQDENIKIVNTLNSQLQNIYSSINPLNDPITFDHQKYSQS